MDSSFDHLNDQLPSVIALFSSSCEKTAHALSGYSFTHNVWFETVCFFYTVFLLLSESSDLPSSFTSSVNSSIISDPFLSGEHTTDQTGIMESRFSLYSSVFNYEIDPRFEWKPDGSLFPFHGDPFGNMLICFGDILVNPLCADDYDKSPRIYLSNHDRSFFEFTFCLTLRPIIKTVTDFFFDLDQ